MNEIIKIFKELGASTPFDENGNYTEDGVIALEKLLAIVGDLNDIGAIKETSGDVEAYLDEIVINA